MTIEQRLEQVEQQNQKIQRTNKRLTVALTMTVVAMCAVVTMAAKRLEDANFDEVRANRVIARSIYVTNHTGAVIVGLTANDGHDGMIRTHSAEGTNLVKVTSTMGDQGMVTTYQPDGKALVTLNASDDGGTVNVYNKTGEGIAQMSADEYGNGSVGAYNRKGEGRTLQPGP
jgi:peptidoglycan hydrolase-like amidase